MRVLGVQYTALRVIISIFNQNNQLSNKSSCYIFVCGAGTMSTGMSPHHLHTSVPIADENHTPSKGQHSSCVDAHAECYSAHQKHLHAVLEDVVWTSEEGKSQL